MNALLVKSKTKIYKQKVKYLAIIMKTILIALMNNQQIFSHHQATQLIIDNFLNLKVIYQISNHQKMTETINQ